MTKITLYTKFLSFAIISVFLLAGESFARQTTDPLMKRNSPYAPNPKRKTAPVSQPSAPEVKTVPKTDKAAMVQPPKEIAKANTPPANTANPQPEKNVQPDSKDLKYQNAEFESRSIAKKTFEVAKRATNTAISPTETYKVGIGDVLFISLQNAPAKESSYFTVLKDGTIDYPLAGEMVSVLNLTAEEIQRVLQDKIKLYENPQVLVKLREYNSHTYTVLGLVEKVGERPLQREAIPLFVVRAEALVQSKATRAVVKRANSQTETFDLRDKKYEEALIFPGDIVEFDAAGSANSEDEPQVFYIAGQVVDGGRKQFYKGMRLTQAIIVAGDVKKPSVKNIVIRRKNEAGMLVSTTYDLKAIKEGKFADPIIEAGDTIEVGN